MIQWATEATTLVVLRTTLGDETTGEILFKQDYDPDFVSRHTHQLSSLLEATYDD